MRWKVSIFVKLLHDIISNGSVSGAYDSSRFPVFDVLTGSVPIDIILAFVFIGSGCFVFGRLELCIGIGVYRVLSH